MKFILEWKKFLSEVNFVKDYPLQKDEEGDIELYHVSATSGIEEFDPDIAAAGAKNYTTRDYITWNRPRVFFFTKLGQQDTGIGRIPGDSFYKVKVPAEKLYPIMEDPAQLSGRDSIQNYLVENVPKFEEKFKVAQKCDSVKNNYNQYHICSKIPNSDGLAWYEDRFAGKRLLIDDPKFHSERPNPYELVAILAEERYGVIGFIYPQSKGERDTMIAVIWRPIKAEKVDDFYME